MPSHRPIVRALLMTTATAWSIEARRTGEADEHAPGQWSDSAGMRRQPGPVVMPFRAIPGAGAAPATEQRAAAWSWPKASDLRNRT